MYQPITGVGDGTAPVVTITFPFLDKAHVHASVDGSEVAFTWTGASQITFTDPVTNGVSWKVYRDTSIAASLVDFTNGSVLTEIDLDTANAQHQYVDQELSSRIDTEAADRASAVSAEATARADADATEVSLRTAADDAEAASRATAIANEASLRAAADTTEAQQRSSADAAILSAIQNAGGSLGTVTLEAADRTILAALNTSLGLSAYLLEAGREGVFRWDPADHSADVTADPRQGVYVAPASDPTGATGAWVRNLNGVTLTDYMFGAVDGADNADAIEAWANFVWAHDVGHAAWLSESLLSRGVNVGTGVPVTKSFLFAPTLKAVVAMDAMVTLNASYCSIEWAMVVRGWNSDSSGATLAQRLAKVGVRFMNTARLRSTGILTATDFYYWAVKVDSANGNNNYGEIPFINAAYCGSSVLTDNLNGPGHVVSANWSAPVTSGSNGSTSQQTVLTVDAVPLDPLASDPQRIVYIANAPYRISSIVDNGNGTWALTLSMPWLDSASVAAGSGTLKYIFGGMLGITGSNSNAMKSHGGSPAFVGFAVLDQALTGAHIEELGSNAQVDVYYGFGNGPTSSQKGGSLKGGYLESGASLYQVMDFSFNATTNKVIGQWDGQPRDFSKWFKFGPRASAAVDVKKAVQFDSIVSLEGAEGKCVVAEHGHTFTAPWTPGTVPAGQSVSTTMTVDGVSLAAFQTRRTGVSFDLGLGSLIATAAPTSDNGTHTTTTFTVTLFNPTAANITLGSGNVSITLMLA